MSSSVIMSDTLLLVMRPLFFNDINRMSIIKTLHLTLVRLQAPPPPHFKPQLC